MSREFFFLNLCGYTWIECVLGRASVDNMSIKRYVSWLKSGYYSQSNTSEYDCEYIVLRPFLHEIRR